RVGVVQRLPGSLPRHAEDQSAGTGLGRETDLSGRELEVALQQPAGDDTWLQCAKLHLQRPRVPDRLRVRRVDVRSAKAGCSTSSSPPVEAARNNGRNKSKDRYP